MSCSKNDHMFTLCSELLSQGCELWLYDEEGTRESELNGRFGELEPMVWDCYRTLCAADLTEVVVLVNGIRNGWFTVLMDEGKLVLSDWTMGMYTFIDNALNRASEAESNV